MKRSLTSSIWINVAVLPSSGSAKTANGTAHEKARADARLILEGVIDSVSQSRTFESNSVVWMKQTGEGSVQEPLKLPNFNGPAAPVFNGSVLADIPASDFTSPLASLSPRRAA